MWILYTVDKLKYSSCENEQYCRYLKYFLALYPSAVQNPFTQNQRVCFVYLVCTTSFSSIEITNNQILVCLSGLHKKLTHLCTVATGPMEHVIRKQSLLFFNPNFLPASKHAPIFCWKGFCTCITKCSKRGCLSFCKYVDNLCKSANENLRTSVSLLGKYLDQKSCEVFVHALVTSKGDYLNSLLIGLPAYCTMIHKLQKIQITAVQIVTRKKYSHITPLLKELLWLPVDYRITFKVLLHFVLIGFNTPFISTIIYLHGPART